MPLWFAIVLLGIIEGITEFLPISSTGHLLIAQRWLPRQSDLFNVVIQCGAVLAVLPLFPQRLNQFFYQWREKRTQDYLLKLAFAFALTCAGAFIADKRGYTLPKQVAPIVWALFIGGVGFVVVELWLRGRPLHEEVTWAVALAVGIGQILAAIFPGTSRSGASILFCLILGLARPAATEFSFLVGIPTMLAAGGWEILKTLRHHSGEAAAENWGMVVLGFIVAAVVSFIAVKWLLRYVQTHTFILFGWYRIALAFAMAALLMSHR